MSTTTPALSELDPLLASLNELKAPGANKSKISTITTICVKNIQSEQSIVQSFYRALKKAPATHKLGALYVIDSVIRQWTDKAKKAGQELFAQGRGEPGTYSAALKRVAELMPALLHDTLKVIPIEQKPKLSNLVDIWDRGNFFPSKVIAEVKQKLSDENISSAGAPSTTSTAAASAAATTKVNGHAATATSEKFRPALLTRPRDTTPVGYPPQYLYDQGFLIARNTQNSQQQIRSPAKPQSQPASVDNILAALAASAPKTIPQQSHPITLPPPPPQPQAIPANIMAMLGGQQPQPPLATQPTFSVPPSFAQPLPPPTGFPPLPPQPFVQPVIQDPLAPLRGILPANILNDQQKLMQALSLLQELQTGGLPMDQWGPVIQAFSEQSEQAPQDNGRRRSRSPDRRVRGRGSPVYGNYDDLATKNDDRARYRQRSPMRNSPAPMNGLAMNGNPMQPKVILMDTSLPPDNIKVLSRTLFVGGANGTQQEIHTLFERFGRVQTCIANRDKRHAFVKMTTRQYALNAKAGMEQMQTENNREVMNIARQTKWGVGFGPRECCDYARGESIIPIHKLTEADVKWLHTAEYGGTGGKELHGGMVLEEPDIEIGAGVSSKAMSKRVAPDTAQPKGREEKPRGGGGGGRQNRGHRDRDDVQMGGMPMEAYGYARPEPVAVATPPAVPGFGFTLPGR